MSDVMQGARWPQRLKSDIASQWRRHLLLVPLAIAFCLPLVIMIVASLKGIREVMTSGLLQWPRHLTLGPWREAWDGACIGISCQGLHGYFVNSLAIAFPATVLSMSFGAFSGYALARWTPGRAKAVAATLVFCAFIPFQCVLIPATAVLAAANQFGTRTGLVLVHFIYGVPLMVIVFNNYFAAIPQDLIKAAHIDGAGFLQVFRHIYVPLAGPIFAVAAIMQFTAVWNDFLFNLVFSDEGNTPIMVALNNLVNSSFGVKPYNVNMAAAIIAALPTLLIYLFAGRWFIRGLTAGAIKG